MYGFPYPLRLFAASLLVLATTPAAVSAGLHFERIGSESGPPTDVITAIYRDRTGFVWIGSRDGLTLYDGHGFRAFEHDASDPRSISDNAIRTIYEDSAGNLWIGTNTGGLNRLDRASWTFDHFRHDSSDPHSLSHDSVYAVLEDHEGTLWVGTQQGLNRFDRESGRFEQIHAEPVGTRGLSNDYVMAIHQDQAGRLWVATLGGGLNLWEPERGMFRAFRHDPRRNDSLSSDSVTSITEDRDGGLWVGTVEGLNLFDVRAGSFTRYDHDPGDPGGLSNPLVTALAPGPEGRLWVGTHGGGLNELNVASGRFRHWRNEPQRNDSLGDDEIITLLADDLGALWIGTWGGGLRRLTPTAMLLASYSEAGSLPEDVAGADVTALTYDAEGRAWIGTRDGDLLAIEPGRGSHRRYLGGDASGRSVLALAPGARSQVWAGSSAGLDRIDPVSGEILSLRHDPGDPGSLGAGYVRAVLVDRDERVWVGTGEGGLNLLDGAGRVLDRFVNDPADPTSLSDDYVVALFEDSLGTLWVGTRSGGLNAFDPSSGKFQRYLPDADDPNALSHHSVTSLLEDSRGRLWVGTAGGGINRVERHGDGTLDFTRFTERDGLIDNDVMGILEDEDGSLWLSTKRGLGRLDPEERKFAGIHVSDGLPTGEFEPGAVARGPGSLAFGTVKGLVVLPLGIPFPAPRPSPTVVLALRTADGPLEGDAPAWQLRTVSVPYGEWVSAELAVLDYSPEQRHRYAYRLDDEWVELDSRREITFSGLNPGKHEFAARGRNGQGVWSTETPPLTIEIVPPFWMTLWFRLTLVAALVATAVVIHRVRTSALERRNRKLVELHRQRELAQRELGGAYERLRLVTRRLEAAKEDERRRIARELHDEMGPSLTAAIINLQLMGRSSSEEERAQKIDDTVEIVDRMVQRVRDLSLDLRPPLLEELGLIGALRGYLETQAQRSNLRIDVTEETPVDVLSPEIEISAFRVVQEAVTNVIRHAGATRVGVSVRQNGQDLDLVIGDDGAGFDVGAVLAGASGKSLGLLGMQERVQTLGGRVSIRSAPGRGTEIRARLPLEADS